MKKLVFTLIVFGMMLHSYAQETDCNFVYKHYQGTVGKDSAVMDLMIHNGNIHGSLVFPGRPGEMNDNDIRTERLEGALDRYGIATIEGYPLSGKMGEYSGKISGTFKGTCRDPETGLAKSFSLIEEYAGSIPLKGYCIIRDTLLLDTVSAPGAHLEMAVLLPDEDSLEYIRKEIFKALLNMEELNSQAGDDILNQFCSEYFRKYIESNIDIYDGGYSFNWEMTGNTSVSLNRNGLLVYRIDNYAFTGGAHGMGISRFRVFDTDKEIKIALEDIFPDSVYAELSSLLESKYREMYFLDEDELLSDAGLFDDNIIPSQNFWISENGISFFYNPYELAPYSMGSITISLHFSAFRHLLKEDVAVSRLGW